MLLQVKINSSNNEYIQIIVGKYISEINETQVVDNI